MGDITVSRAYDREPTEGAVFLVDRMWPRGVRKDDLRLDGWARDVAPSADLRRWFGHRPERFEEFRARYLRELDANQDAVHPLLEAARRGPVTLVYSAKDTEHNNAVVLREYLRRHLTPSLR
ncbi:DUF488 family protein [Streptosporangium sp. NPDC051023]|uniref:DUF488 domain-containing protein n=1 Tax=Streptosporangium sp. NPDC051023 TaxID=3155410 RepID=UPI00344D57EB